MKTQIAELVLILLCLASGVALGGGIYESTVLARIWRRSPPSSFAIFHPGRGVPLQRFWIPVHIAITVLVIVALITVWNEIAVRRWMLVGLGSYVVMRTWSGIYFIPEMLRFQRIPLDAAPSPELNARVAKWNFWTWFREPLDVISLVAYLLALARLPGA